MAQARKAQACGKDTMAYLLVRNAQKQLSTAQVKQLVEAYATIKSLLESGSLTTAKEEISAAVADGVIVTEADKTALNQFIDGCKP
jgi:wobble nucleotide-excising tRNase